MDTTLPKKSSPFIAEQLMIRDVPTFSASTPIHEVEHELLRNAKKFDAINYIYIVNTKNLLVGVLSIKEAFRREAHSLIGDTMTQELITIRPHTSQERLTVLAVQHNLKEIPVVDAEGHFLGTVPYNTIIDILRQKDLKQTLQGAGIHHFGTTTKNITKATPLILIKKRLPWLLIGLLGSIAAASVIATFQTTIASQLLLAAFIPAVTYISGAAAVQSETMLIRSATLDEEFNFSKYLLKEVRVGLGLSFILSMSMMTISYIVWGNLLISMILGVSILISIVISMHIAILIPWLLAKLKFDPAITGGPLDTILSDIVAITLYFTFANLILGIFT